MSGSVLRSLTLESLYGAGRLVPSPFGKGRLEGRLEGGLEGLKGGEPLQGKGTKDRKLQGGLKGFQEGLKGGFKGGLKGGLNEKFQIYNLCLFHSFTQSADAILVSIKSQMQSLKACNHSAIFSALEPKYQSM